MLTQQLEKLNQYVMTPNLPAYIPVVFGLTVLATLLFFYRIVRHSSSEAVRNRSTLILAGLVLWLILQAVLTLNGVYQKVPTAGPPNLILFGILPALVVVVLLFVTRNGQAFVASLPLTLVTYLNTVRVVVELVLYWLFLHKVVPQLMTFEGRNFDIIAGITAPFVAYFGLTKGKLSRQGVLIWNVICLILLLNIVVIALLSAPTPLQQFGFEQPNLALGIFPFSWLPTFIIPLVLLGHLVSVRRLWKR